MGAYDTWNVEINILVCENKMFSLTAEFHFNNWLEIGVHYVWLCQIPLESPWKGDSKKILTFWPAPATSWLTRKSVLSPCLKMITRLKMSQDGCSSSMIVPMTYAVGKPVESRFEIWVCPPPKKKLKQMDQGPKIIRVCI